MFLTERRSSPGLTSIDIGSGSQSALGQLLSYYEPSPKNTLDGLEFQMYAGFYLFLITEGENHRFLSAKSERELKAKSKYRWENVPGIETHLESCLLYNLRRSPLAVSLLTESHLPVVWHEPHRELRNAEKRWLRVVTKALDRLRQG